MARHKHQPEDPMAHLPISQLSPDGQLRRAFPVWVEGSVENAKCLGDVVRFMIESEREDSSEVQHD